MPIYLIPIIVLVANQLLKLIIETIKGNFSWNHLTSNGGMPSSHSSFASSAATVIYLTAGPESPIFVLALAIAMIVIWDAFTTRHQIGFQGNILNKLIKELPDKQEYKYPLLNERTGHSLSEVIVGIIIGIGLTWLLF
ncbi:MAG: divergent PAP2 family protein [Candidatus Komeilibacteria bacterium]